MGYRYYSINITTSPQTGSGAPQFTTWQLERERLVSIEIDVPSGHNGLTGIRFIRSNQQVLPWSNNQYLILNDRLIPVQVDEELTEGRLVVATFNNDFVAHTHYLRATIANLVQPASSTNQDAPIVATALLTSAGVPLKPAAGG